MLPKSSIESKLDDEILSLLDKLKSTTDSDEYDTLVEHISKLHKIKSEEKTEFKMPSLDTVLIVSANIFGILWLTRFERENVITSRSALGFVMKPR